MLKRVPFAPGERFTMQWGCCGGTHASPTWQNNGNDYYAGAGTVVVAPIAGEVVRVGTPPIGQGIRVGIQGEDITCYLAHMSDVGVRMGQTLAPGDRIGEVWDWNNSGMPPHLHFSTARGHYGAGIFLDPWDSVAALGIHINGRVYEAPGSALARPTDPPKPAAPKLYLEELPARLGGMGPSVFGPWRDTTPHRRRRAENMEAMRAKGRDVQAVEDPYGDLYILEHHRDRTTPYRFGSWATAAARERAEKALRADGRLTRPRAFTGAPNSLYPQL